MQDINRTAFNDICHELKNALSKAYQYNIKLSRVREILAKSMGFNSSNHLISELPLSLDSILNSRVADFFEKSLLEIHGFKVNGDGLVRDCVISYLSKNREDDAGYDRHQPTKQNIGKHQFVPVNESTLAQSVSHLSWLTGENKETSEDLLANIYGFKSIKGVREAIKSSKARGPFSNIDNFGYEYHENLDTQDRTHVIDSSMYQLRNSSNEYPSYRDRQIGELCLFDKPDKQIEAYEKLRLRLSIYECESFGNTDRPATDYATVAFNSQNKPYLKPTHIGSAVLDIGRLIVPDYPGHEGDAPFEEVEEHIFKVIDQHPNCPWLRALWIDYAARRCYLSNWSQCTELLSHGRGFNPNVPPEIYEYSYDNANWLLPECEITIKQFQEIFGKLGSKAVSSRRHETGGETSLWPNTLYWGGRIALIAENFNLSKEWLKLNYSIEKDCYDYWAKRYLSVIYLNDGSGNVSRLNSKKKVRDGWATLCVAMDKAAKSEVKESVKLFTEVCFDNYGCANYFSPGIQKESIQFININTSAPPEILELVYLCSTFLRQNHKVGSLFSYISENENFRKALNSYYKIKQDRNIDVFIKEDKVIEARNKVLVVSSELADKY